MTTNKYMLCPQIKNIKKGCIRIDLLHFEYFKLHVYIMQYCILKLQTKGT